MQHDVFYQATVLLSHVLCLELWCQWSSSNVDTILSVELLQLTDDVVDDQFVKTLQELSAKVFVEEVDEADAPALVAVHVVPSAHLV